MTTIDNSHTLIKDLWLPHVDSSAAEGLHIAVRNHRPQIERKSVDSDVHFFGSKFTPKTDFATKKHFFYVWAHPNLVAQFHSDCMKFRIPEKADSSNIPQLRIFAFPVRGLSTASVNLYHEIGLGEHHWIVGGLTNFKEEDRPGRQAMDSLLLLLLEVYRKKGIEVEYFKAMEPLPPDYFTRF